MPLPVIGARRIDRLQRRHAMVDRVPMFMAGKRRFGGLQASSRAAAAVKLDTAIG